MKADNIVLHGYEDTKLVNYEDSSLPNTYWYDGQNEDVKGVLKMNRHVNGRLLQTYSKEDSHALVLAATRQGKTTSFVIPTLYSFANQKRKCSLVVSDPKLENYRLTADALKKNGWEVLLFNFRDYMHSEYWNPLTDIFRKYKKAMTLEDEVETINGGVYKFRGVTYKKQKLLDEAIEQLRDVLLADVDMDIDTLMFHIIPPDEAKDQYWNDAPRQTGKALIWAMLEDSDDEKGKATITEDTFSFNTMFTIMDWLSEDERYDNDEFFTGRDDNSKAKKYAKVLLNNASGTRQCVASCFYAKLSAFRNSTIRLITCCSSFDMSMLVSQKPVAIFISYPDESKVYYKVISTLIQSMYEYLIGYTKKQPSGKLDFPFYFILDEFGNFPKIPDFDTVISACGGRNIWFNIILQSYAQLNTVYGKETAETIRDNLNIHIFLGSNNPTTLKDFSDECGFYTRICPTSALNGSKGEIEHYTVETIPLVPRSMLARLQPGECVITEVNSGYVLFSKMERYYTCKEFFDCVLSYEMDYRSKINPLNKKYAYKPKKTLTKKKFDFDF